MCCFLITMILVTFLLWKVYESYYYKSNSFLRLKKSINKLVFECNELNAHIEELKNYSLIGYNQLNEGISQFHDSSVWNYKRPQFNKFQYASNEYHCSRQVCANARNKPFVYVCKYFNIEMNEESLERYEEMLNEFSAVEDGKIKLSNQKALIINHISSRIPFLIKKFSRRLDREIGFEAIDFSIAYYPRYIFSYVSPGGNSSLRTPIVMDIPNLERFIVFISENIEKRKSIRYQRSLMTRSLRMEIMKRDDFTCKRCGNSTKKEPNLLLEIDHIKPLSRGGITTPSNLQTLCWKCNRKKGSKII